MNKIKDISGLKFGNLTVIKYSHSNKNKQSFWICRCICENEVLITKSNLKNGNTNKSCGCIKKIIISKLKFKHGFSISRTKEYNTWKRIKQRCYNKNALKYKDYGGRGIIVCDEWKNSFENFINDMGLKPSPKHSIERIDNNGNYCKGNCKWATPKEQCNNQRTNRILEYKGEKMNIAQWSEKTGLKRGTITSRIDNYNWSIEKTLTSSVENKKRTNYGKNII